MPSSPAIADAARRNDQAAGRRHLHLDAAGPARAAQGRAIVREEMNRAGAIELLMPAVQPAELWQESGTLGQVRARAAAHQGPSRARYSLQPTPEEVITDIARKEIKSYRQLPVNFYQIQTKFRDEIRPRFGVMRAREFIMKDAYSFHVDKAAMLKSYQAMYDAYARIFTRLGPRLPRGRTRTPARSAGSHRTNSRCWPIRARTQSPVAPTPTTPPTSSWPRRAARTRSAAAPSKPCRKSPHPGSPPCEQVAELLHLPLSRHGQVHHADGRRTRCTCCSLRGDHTLNELKAGRVRRARRLSLGQRRRDRQPRRAASRVISGRSELLPRCR